MWVVEVLGFEEEVLVGLVDEERVRRARVAEWRSWVMDCEGC